MTDCDCSVPYCKSSSRLIKCIQTLPTAKGGATVLKVGGDNFASGASEKNFLTPPPYDYLGGTEINMVVLNLLIGMA